VRSSCRFFTSLPAKAGNPVFTDAAVFQDNDPSCLLDARFRGHDGIVLRE
jgi:hypothetical protein